MRMGAHQTAAGFTLAEIMIVVAILGLLATIAIPSLVMARRAARISAFTNDLRLALDAFELYAINEGNYPPDAMPAVVPAGMAEYLPKMNWSAPTPLGGQWDWERIAVGIGAGVSALGNNLRVAEMREVDDRIDDGLLTSGRFRRLSGNRYTYVIEE